MEGWREPAIKERARVSWSVRDSLLVWALASSLIASEVEGRYASPPIGEGERETSFIRLHEMLKGLSLGEA